MEITRKSMVSGVERTRSLEITPEQWALFESGEHIQRALPHLSDGDREFILTGITDEEWDAEFAEPEDEPEDDEWDDCGLMPDGQCTKAGSEECDWICGALHRLDQDGEAF